MSLSSQLDALIAPAPEPARVAFLKGQPYAHRGLHGVSKNGRVLENSPAAFDAAIKLGHGIECDVQAAEDGTAFVFHDFELDRLTTQQGKLVHLRASDIDQIDLKDGNGKIPRLRATLVQVAGQVPILIEIKSNNMRVGPLCLSVRRALEGYTGKAAVMSFNPLVCAWFRKNANHIIRGLVVIFHLSLPHQTGPEACRSLHGPSAPQSRKNLQRFMPMNRFMRCRRPDNIQVACLSLLHNHLTIPPA